MKKGQGWENEWTREADGSLQHSSGLKVVVAGRDDDGVDLETDEASLALFQANLRARGADLGEIDERLRALLGQAASLYTSPPSPDEEEDLALVHLRVPASMKGRWVQASRAKGMRLTDYIVQAVERQIARD